MKFAISTPLGHGMPISCHSKGVVCPYHRTQLACHALIMPGYQFLHKGLPPLHGTPLTWTLTILGSKTVPKCIPKIAKHFLVVRLSFLIIIQLRNYSRTQRKYQNKIVQSQGLTLSTLWDHSSSTEGREENGLSCGFVRLRY